MNFGQKMNEKTVEIRELFDSLYLCSKQLTSAQIEFIQSLKKHYARTGELSERQMKILLEIKKYLPAQDARFSGAKI